MITILTPSARAFISADGKRFEWRRNRENPTSYDVRAFICPLYAGRDLGLSNSYTLLKICESHAFEDLHSLQLLAPRTRCYSTPLRRTGC